jgi:hypothetical protein
MAGRQPALVALEERLAGDKTKAELAKVIAELDGYLADARKAMDSGLAPQEFRSVAKYRAALERARDAVSKIWALTVEL